MTEGGKEIEVVSECDFIVPAGKKTSIPRSVRLRQVVELGTAQHHVRDRELSCVTTMKL